MKLSGENVFLCTGEKKKVQGIKYLQRKKKNRVVCITIHTSKLRI